jgi:acyl carrier protein
MTSLCRREQRTYLEKTLPRVLSIDGKWLSSFSRPRCVGRKRRSDGSPCFGPAASPAQLTPIRRSDGMNADTIMSRLTTIFRDSFERDDLVLRPDMTMDDLAGWDSSQNVNLLMSVEADFKIKIGVAEAEMIHNVGDLVSLIQTKV